MRRTGVVVLGALLMPLALTGCSNSEKCSGATCTVKIGKPGSHIVVGQRSDRYRDSRGKRRTRQTGGTDFRLESVAGNTARLTVGGQSVTCRQGESVPSLAANVTCTKVGPGIEMRVQLLRR